MTKVVADRQYGHGGWRVIVVEPAEGPLIVPVISREAAWRVVRGLEQGTARYAWAIIDPGGRIVADGFKSASGLPIPWREEVSG